jgi:hypothetical protein
MASAAKTASSFSPEIAMLLMTCKQSQQILAFLAYAQLPSMESISRA